VAVLSERTLQQLIDDVAARTPAPGGGSVAAWTCAFAAALIEMSATFTMARPDHANRRERMLQIRVRVRSLRDTATELGERELHAYEPVLEALRLPQDDPDRAGRLERALSESAETPLELARVAAEIASLALEVARTATPHLRGDATAGLLLAESACQAAGRLVAINLASHRDDPRHAETEELTRRASSLRDAVL
jgi:formiminotetrahydrofolate cyclodeaminase